MEVITDPLTTPVAISPDTKPAPIDEPPSTPAPQAWYWQATIDGDGILVPWRIGPLELWLLALLATA